MAKRKVETSYCTTPRRFTMVVMLVQRVRVQADHNVTSNERVVLLDVMEETVEARDAAEGACVVVVKERASAFSGLEKQHSDLDRTMQFLGAREGLQGSRASLWGRDGPHTRAGPVPGAPPHPPLRISLRRTAQRGKLGN